MDVLRPHNAGRDSFRGLSLPRTGAVRLCAPMQGDVPAGQWGDRRSLRQRTVASAGVEFFAATTNSVPGHSRGVCDAAMGANQGHAGGWPFKAAVDVRGARDATTPINKRRSPTLLRSVTESRWSLFAFGFPSVMFVRSDLNCGTMHWWSGKTPVRSRNLISKVQWPALSSSSQGSGENWLGHELF